MMTYYIISTNSILEKLWQESPVTYSTSLEDMLIELPAIRNMGLTKARIYKLVVTPIGEGNESIHTD